MKAVWRSTTMSCHENKQQPKLRTDLEVKSQRCNFFISLLCVSIFGHTGNRTKNVFPWVPWRNMYLTVQEICALSRDFTGYYFLLLPEMLQCQWSDEAVRINKMWLRSALGHAYIINQFIFLLIITFKLIFCSSPDISISFTADSTWLGPAFLQAQWRCHLSQQQWKDEVAMLDFALRCPAVN